MTRTRTLSHFLIATLAVAGCSFDVDGLVLREQDAATQEGSPDASQPDAMRDAAVDAAEVAGEDGSATTPDATARDANTPSDGAFMQPDAAVLPPVPAFPAGQPALVQGLSSPQDPTLSGDQLEMILNVVSSNTASDLVVLTRNGEDEPFSPPTLLTTLNSPQEDTSPELSRDGLTLWFVSNRHGRFVPYRSRRATRSSAWTAPERFDFGIDNSQEVYSATPTPDDLQLVLCVRTGTSKKLYLASANPTSSSTNMPITLAGWPATASDAGGMIDERGRLWFASDAKSPGESKLYYADPLAFGSFAQPQALDGVNMSFGSQHDVWISVDGRDLYFVHTAGGMNTLMHTSAL